MRFRLILPLLVVLSAVLAACTPPTPNAAAAFTSHTSGQTIHGSRTIVVTAQLTGAQPGALIGVTTDARDFTK